MRTNTTPTSNTSGTTNHAGVSPAPPELHQRTDRQGESRATAIFISADRTVELLRQALAESFVAIEFRIRARKYIDGACIDVCWADGPTRRQVDAVAQHFAGAVFDSEAGQGRHVLRNFDGHSVAFGANFVFCDRFITDATVDLAIDQVYRRRRALFDKSGLDKPTVRQYAQCELQNVFLSPACECAGKPLELEITAALCVLSFCPPAASATLARFDKPVAATAAAGSAS